MDADVSDVRKAKYDPLKEPPKITWDVLRKFQPLNNKSSHLWKSSLEHIRQRFVNSAEKEQNLFCLLTQSIVPAFPKRPPGPFPSGIDGLRPVAVGGGPSREVEQLFLRRDSNGDTVVSGVAKLFQENWQLKILDIGQGLVYQGTEYQTFVGDKPLLDLAGEPILFSTGEPVAMQQGCGRSYFIYSDHPCNAYTQLAKEAGNCLCGLPPSLNRVLWKDWLDGFDELDGGCMWTNAVFELAWQQHPGTALKAKKLAWSGHKSVPLDAWPLLSGRLKGHAGDAWLDDLGDPPAHWYSTIENMHHASVAAIDILLSIHDQFETDARKQFNKEKLTIAIQESSPPKDQTGFSELIDEILTRINDTDEDEWWVEVSELLVHLNRIREANGWGTSAGYLISSCMRTTEGQLVGPDKLKNSTWSKDASYLVQFSARDPIASRGSEGLVYKKFLDGRVIDNRQERKSEATQWLTKWRRFAESKSLPGRTPVESRGLATDRSKLPSKVTNHENHGVLETADAADSVSIDLGHGQELATTHSLLLSVYTEGVSDDRVKRAIEIAQGSGTANDRIEKIDNVLPIPPTTSARKLGALLGVSGQAVANTDWWKSNRRGRDAEVAARRSEAHAKRSTEMR